MENLEAMRAARNYNASIAARAGAAAKRCPERLLAVDFGAGIGTFTGAVAPLFERTIAVEVEEASLQRLREAGYEVRRELAEIADGTVDFVFSISVLEHIDDDVAVLREFRRVLKPGGRVFIYVPAQVHQAHVGAEPCRRWVRRDARGLCGQPRGDGLAPDAGCALRRTTHERKRRRLRSLGVPGVTNDRRDDARGVREECVL